MMTLSFGAFPISSSSLERICHHVHMKSHGFTGPQSENEP